ncbi:MAG TPA: phosphoribosylamine--glycine ligase [Crenalkalicoccus sp.]|nr:phosphoribosylamine--glycine ligase [Crenalkalicoccus sp.]
MRRSLTPVLLALLAGCSLFRGPPPPPPDQDTPTHRACRAEAADAPAVRALWSQANPDGYTNRERIARDRAVAEQRAYAECLRRNGLPAPGGVQPVERR